MLVECEQAMTIRETVFQRDDDQCRIPWCHRRTMLEWAHLDAKGMGGSPAADTTANTICACRSCHQGPRSIHSGHLKWRFLTSQGADGPMCWEYYEKRPKADAAEIRTVEDSHD